MKTIITLFTCLFFTVGLYAQNTGKSTNQNKGMGDKYVAGYSKNACVCTVKSAGNGQVAVYQNGAQISNEIKVGAARVTPTGILKKDGGAERVLRPGNCVSDKGTITMMVE